MPLKTFFRNIKSTGSSAQQDTATVIAQLRDGKGSFKMTYNTPDTLNP